MTQKKNNTSPRGNLVLERGKRLGRQDEERKKRKIGNSSSRGKKKPKLAGEKGKKKPHAQQSPAKVFLCAQKRTTGAKTNKGRAHWLVRCQMEKEEESDSVLGGELP